MSQKNNEKLPHTWSIAEVWNTALTERPKREAQARDHLWASELGKAPVDVWLRLKGTEPTNPPNARSLRKFEAGNLFEWIVGLALKRAGVYQSSQDRVTYQFEGLPEVSGKVDFLVGGQVKNQDAKEELKSLELPPMFYQGFEAVYDYLSEKYPDGLATRPLEVKSVSVYMFESIDNARRPLGNHRMQVYHYMKSLNIPFGSILYICRDDLRMMEFHIEINEQNDAEYRSKIEAVDKYIKLDERPPLEQPVVFDKDLGKFSKNFNVAYSEYLTLLYGYESQAEFDEVFTKQQLRWNRVLGRIKNGDNMTEKNKEVIAEIQQAGFDLEEIVGKSADVILA